MARRDKQRAIVTRNVRDFRILAARWHVDGRRHAGLVLIAMPTLVSRDGIGALVEALAALDEARPHGLRNSETWL